MSTATPLRTEKRPANPVPKGPRPGSRYPVYRVKNGDDWASVAQVYSVPVSTLLMHNFATTDPGEINWYLREYVGCNVATHDRLNWCFSSSAKPGLIYAPGPGLIVAPRKPDEPVVGPTPGPVDPADESSPNWQAASLGAFEKYEGLGGGVELLAFRNLSNNTNFYYAGLRTGAGFSFDPVKDAEKIAKLLRVLGYALWLSRLPQASWYPVTVYHPFSANEINLSQMDCYAGNISTGAPFQNYSYEQVTLRDHNYLFGGVTFKGSWWWDVPDFSGQFSTGVLIRIW